VAIPQFLCLIDLATSFLVAKKILNTKKFQNSTIDVSSFAKGTYLFKLFSKEADSAQRVIIEYYISIVKNLECFI
jgi:hypothetical protein